MPKHLLFGTLRKPRHACLKVHVWGPPRSGAGVGVGMLTVAWDSLTSKLKKGSRCLVFGFWFYGFIVLWFDGYQMSISRFQEDIDPMSNLFKILFNGPSSCFGAHLFQNCQTIGFPKFRYPQNTLFLKGSRDAS